MAGFAGRWWVAGGWALDLFLGHKTRPHADLELSILAGDQSALFEHLRGWDLRLAAPGASLPAWDGATIRPPFHQVWARCGPARPASPDQFAADPTMVGFLLEQGSRDCWVFRPSRHHPAPGEFGTRTVDGVGFVRPEIALLFGPRQHDSRISGLRPDPAPPGPGCPILAGVGPEQAHPSTPGVNGYKDIAQPMDDRGAMERPAPLRAQVPSSGPTPVD